MIVANLAPVICGSSERSCMLGIKVSIKKFGEVAILRDDQRVLHETSPTKQPSIAPRGGNVTNVEMGDDVSSLFAVN